MEMGTLRTMLKRRRLQYEIKIGNKQYIGPMNRGHFLAHTIDIPDTTEINITRRASAIVIHSDYSLQQEVF